MNNKNKSLLCNCKEIEEKIISLLKNNGNLLHMIRQLKKGKEKLEEELERQRSVNAGPRPDRTGNDHNNAELQPLIQISHGWKRDYEDLQTRYELLSGKNNLLQDGQKQLKERVSELERRQARLENEITRLGSALLNCDNVQEDGIPYHGQYEILKSQFIFHKEDCGRERRDRKKLHDKMVKLKREVEGSNEIIKKLAAELDEFKARNERTSQRIHVPPEVGYLREKPEYLPGHQVQLILPYALVMPMSDYKWRMEQQRREIVPTSMPPTTFFYEEDIEPEHTTNTVECLPL